MKVLVTGGAGFIGSHVIDKLYEEGHEVQIFDNFTSETKYIHKALTFNTHNVDVRDFDKMMATLGQWHPEAIVHLAAQPSLLRSEEDPHEDAEINILGTLNMIRLAQEHKTKRFVFSSTSAAERADGDYFTDDQDGVPWSPYGISKSAAESYLLRIPLVRPATAVILRFGNVYGPRQLPLGNNQLVARAMAHIYEGAEFEVYGDGGQMRDFIYVLDVVDAVHQAVINRHDLGGIFNVCTGLSLSVQIVLEFVKIATGYKKKFKQDVHDMHNMRGRYHVHMDNTRFVNTFGWNPQVTPDVGIARTAEWWKERSGA